MGTDIPHSRSAGHVLAIPVAIKLVIYHHSDAIFLSTLRQNTNNWTNPSISLRYKSQLVCFAGGLSLGIIAMVRP